MKILVLGDVDEARGFRLAGLETVQCRTRADVEGTLRARGLALAGTLVLVSDSVYRLTPKALDRVETRFRDSPMVVVLPGAPEGSAL